MKRKRLRKVKKKGEGQRRNDVHLRRKETGKRRCWKDEVKETGKEEEGGGEKGLKGGDKEKEGEERGGLRRRKERKVIGRGREGGEVKKSRRG